MTTPAPTPKPKKLVPKLSPKNFVNEKKMAEHQAALVKRKAEWKALTPAERAARLKASYPATRPRKAASPIHSQLMALLDKLGIKLPGLKRDKNGDGVND